MKQDSEWAVESEWEILPPAPRRRTGGTRPRAEPAVDEYNEPLIRDRQVTPEGVTYTVRLLGPEDTEESLTAEGRVFNPDTQTWEFPRELETVDVQAAAPERLPLQRAETPRVGLMEGAGTAVLDLYRSNPITRQLLNLQSGVARGVQRVGGGAYGLVGQAVDRLGWDAAGNAMIDQANAYQARADEMNAPARADNRLLNQTGQFIGETAATAPVGGLVGRGVTAGGTALARNAPTAGRIVERLGRSVQAGGFLPSAVGRPVAGAAPTLAERGANLAVRGAGGAVSGGLQAALIDEDDAAAGAGIGALLPTIAARPAKWALNRVLDGWQSLAGTLGQSRASDIVRRSLGIDYEAAVAALRNAPEGVTAQQALVDAGVEPSAFMGVGAAVRGATPDAFLATEAAQAAARQAPIDRMAGGTNLTAAQLAHRAGRQDLRAALVPEQARELAAADASGVLDVTPVVNTLMQQADAPGVGTTNSRVLAQVAQALQALADRRGGVPSAEDIYAFRKDDLDDIITRALSAGRGGEVTSQAARRGELVRATQDMLDSAIEAAGGAGWRDYLTNYATGMRSLERQEMMGVAGRTLRQSPNAFVDLVGGETPGVVEGVFGPGRIDLNAMLNPSGIGPSPMEALTRASGEIQRDTRVRTLSQEGAAAARDLLAAQGRRPMFNRMRNIAAFGRPVTATAMEFGAALLDANIPAQTRAALAQAYQSGAGMSELLAMTSAADRAQVLRNIQDPRFWSHLQGAAVNAMAASPAQ